MKTGANFLSWLSAVTSPEFAAVVRAKFANQVLMIPGEAPTAPALAQRLSEVAAEADGIGLQRFIQRRPDRAVQSVCLVELEFGGVSFVMHCQAAEIAGVDRFEVGGFSLARPGSLILFWTDSDGRLRKGLADPVGSPS